MAREYALTVVGRSGDRLTNRTVDSNFTLTDLRCGNTYYLSVSASHENCTSVPSSNITFNTSKSVDREPHSISPVSNSMSFKVVYYNYLYYDVFISQCHVSLPT